MRWTKSVGLGFKTPKEAVTGNYVDKKCPFTGNVSIRGKILQGIVKSTKVSARKDAFERAAKVVHTSTRTAAGVQCTKLRAHL